MLKPLLHTLSIWIVVIPFLIGIMNLRGLNRDSRWIFLLVIIALVPQLMTALVENDGPLFDITYNLYTPIEFILLYMVFGTKYNSSASKTLFRLTAIVYFFICAYFFLHYGIRQKFLSGLVCANNVIYMIWILMFLKQEYATDSFLIKKENPFTWFLIAFIFYAPCTVATFALYHYIREPSNIMLRNLSIIQDIFNIFLYLLFSAGLLIRTHDKKFVS